MNTTDRNPYPQRRRLRLESADYSDPDSVYFVTLCARHLDNPFASTELAMAVIDALNHQRRNKTIRIYAYALMPDHLHLAISPTSQERSIPEVMQAFKSYTTRMAWRYGIHGASWQRSYFDHVAGDEEDVLPICQYIVDNPVRKGLVEYGDKWPYCDMPDPLPL